MRKKWIYPTDKRWKPLRVKKLLKGLRFAERIGDKKMCKIITEEVRRVLLR